MQPDISKRSHQKELIDEQEVEESEMIRNLKELDYFNLLTGNILLTLRLLSEIIKDRNREYHLVDLGCGGGGFLIQADKWAIKKNLKLSLTGVDNNQTTVSYLTERVSGNARISAVLDDYKSFLSSGIEKTDIIHCSLFLHHLDENEIIDLITTARHRKAILIINDLKRSLLAYYAAKALTKLFNGTTLAKNDGPVSVLRGFRKEEIIELVTSAGSKLISITPIPFFRYLIVIKPD
jgi:2-polyprenyl-3-methyl-5-hydroxy-6-metoxy-1,4-benzoquinol methylase